MNREWSRRAGVMAALAPFALVALAACGSVSEVERHDVTRVPVVSDAAAQATREGPAASPTGGEVAASPGAADGEAAPAAAGQIAPVTVASFDIFFEPTEVTIPADTDVTFVLPNEGVTLHNFSIDELGISVDLPPGASEEVVINAPEGTYEFYCNVPGHKEAGMVGTLIVSAEAAPAAAATPVAATEATPTAATPSAATPVAATPVAASPQPGALATPVAATPGAATPTAAGPAPAASAPVEVVSHDIYFEPAEITIPANTDVAVALPNEGVTPHNFSIDELGISVDIQPGATEQTVINAAPGTYEFYCNVPGHKPAGMVGTLVVE